MRHHSYIDRPYEVARTSQDLLTRGFEIIPEDRVNEETDAYLVLVGCYARFTKDTIAKIRANTGIIEGPVQTNLLLQPIPDWSST
jgi:hypothetical protein